MVENLENKLEMKEVTNTKDDTILIRTKEDERIPGELKEWPGDPE